MYTLKYRERKINIIILKYYLFNNPLYQVNFLHHTNNSINKNNIINKIKK